MASHRDTAAATLSKQLEGLDLAGRLALIAGSEGRAVFTTSLGIEDQVIAAEIGLNRLPIDISTLETGRLFKETADLIGETEDRLGIVITRIRPVEEDIDAYAKGFGLNGFYESIEARHACCGVRKMAPLARALAGRRGWITGLRREQSQARADVPLVDTSEVATKGLTKYNPLANWSWGDVWHYIAANGVDYNPLHDGFFPSIGCAPCTRAISLGEDFRAGRWWWEDEAAKECGLHVKNEEKVPA